MGYGCGSSVVTISKSHFDVLNVSKPPGDIYLSSNLADVNQVPAVNLIAWGTKYRSQETLHPSQVPAVALKGAEQAVNS
jgi:hypothetical protein